MDPRELVKRQLFTMDESSNNPNNFRSEMMPGPSSVNNTIWSQVTPENMPWGTAACGNFPYVVRFGGDDGNKAIPVNSSIERPRSDNDNKMIPKTWFAKRKGDFENETARPSKQLITEEHMASQLQSMHISSMYTSHSTADDCDTFNETNRVLEMNEDCDVGRAMIPKGSTVRYPSLILCDELQQLETPNILPPSLVAKLKNPSSALVLWKPPRPILQDTSGRGVNDQNQQKDESEDETEEESENKFKIEESLYASYCANDFLSRDAVSGVGSSTSDTLCDSSDIVEDMSVDV